MEISIRQATARLISRAASRFSAAPLLPLLLLLTLLGSAQAQDYAWTTNNNTITITGYTGPGGSVTIPGTITGLPVVSIGTNAFFACTNLTSVAIPNGVTVIGYQAFYNCTNLTSVAIGDTVTNIVEQAFGNCTRLVSVTIPKNVTRIGSAFYSCSRLKSAFFLGNVPKTSSPFVFGNNYIATVYYLPGTTGWTETYGGRPAFLWNPKALTGDPGFGVKTNGFGFNITGSSNLVLVVEACTNLGGGAWLPVQTNTLADGTSYFSDPQWTNSPERFYRLRSP